MNTPNSEILKDLFRNQMPFGKYKGRIIADLPTYYLEWFAAKGFPEGKLGMLLSTMYEVKVNGLSEILLPIKEMIKKETQRGK